MMMGGKTIHPSVAMYRLMGQQKINERNNPPEDNYSSDERMREVARRQVSDRMKATSLNASTPFGPVEGEFNTRPDGSPRFLFEGQEKSAGLNNVR